LTNKQDSDADTAKQLLNEIEIQALLSERGSNDPATVDSISKKVYEQSQAVWALCDVLNVRLVTGGMLSTSVPEWAMRAIFDKLMRYMIADLQKSHGSGPTSPKHIEVKNNRRHAARYMQVRYLHKHGWTLESAYQRVSDLSEESPMENGPVSDSAIKNSYQLVNKDLKNGGTKYCMPSTFGVREFLLAHLKA